MDFMTYSSQVSTPPETQFTINETFSLEELSLSPTREPHTESPPAAGRRGGLAGKSKRKGMGHGKGVAGESSKAEDVEEAGGGRRIVWSEEEATTLSKAWISVCNDPIVGSNQHIDRMWARIAEAYTIFKPVDGKCHEPEQCWKAWERIRRAITRFADIYENKKRTMTNGQIMDDVKTLSLAEFQEHGTFGAFKYWDAYLVLIDSAKFRTGVGSHDLLNDAEETHPPVPAAVAWLGKRRQCGCLGEVPTGPRRSKSASPSTEPSPALTNLACGQQQMSLFEVCRE